MGYEYASVGTQRFTNQQFLTPTGPNYAYKIMHVTAVGSLTGQVCKFFQTTQTTTATVTTTEYITVPLTDSTTGLVLGDVDFGCGRLIDQNVLVTSFTGQSYICVDYVAIKK